VAAAARPAAGVAPAAAQLPRPPLPAKFTGKQASDVDRFLSEMTKLMDYHCMADEAQRVRYAAQLLADDADVWWASLHQTPVQANAQGLAAPAGLAPVAAITTWADMKQHIIERFRPQLAATEARAALDRQRARVQCALHSADRASARHGRRREAVALPRWAQGGNQTQPAHPRSRP